jgi:hypothetical protein
MTALFPAPNQEYCEKARDRLIAAVDAAEHNAIVTSHLPENLLIYFERLGRELEDGESIEFVPSHPEKPARLNRESRRNLILASAKTQSYIEEVSLRGLIPELDQEKHTFTLLANGDQRIPGNFDASNEDKLLEAFSLYASPTANGGLQAEWTLGEKEISLEINPATRTAAYQALDMGSRETTEFVLDLAIPEGWKQLHEILAEAGVTV